MGKQVEGVSYYLEGRRSLSVAETNFFWKIPYSLVEIPQTIAIVPSIQRFASRIFTQDIDVGLRRFNDDICTSSCIYPVTWLYPTTPTISRLREAK